jgi:hypothetical protein
MPTDTDTTSVATSRTYSLSEAAVILCGDDGPGAQKWIAQRLKGHAKPALPGFKVQRRWRMTQTDLDAAIELLRPQSIPTMTSLTVRSQRRLAAS